MSGRNRKLRHGQKDYSLSPRAARKSRSFDKDISATAFNEQTRREGPTKKKWSLHDITHIQPLTDTQHDVFYSYGQGDNVVGYGSAGTGKSFLAMYLALRDVISSDFPQNRVIIVRSAVPSREVGHLPGTIEEKTQVYETPYIDICTELFRKSSTYADMKQAGIIEFIPTSFVRGSTWDNAIVVVDESQNMTLHEINSVLTRVGQNTRVMVLGDVAQNDFTKKHEVSGLGQTIAIARKMDSFSTIQFGHDDIVRSSFVKEWIIASESLLS